MRSLAIALLLCGCADFGPTCNDLATDLAYCDVRPTRLSCDALSAEARGELEASMLERGCEAVWTDGAVDPRMCEAFDWDCPDAIGHAPSWPASNPVLFVGGIDARPELDWSPRILETVQRETGTEVVHVTLPPWSPVATRAAALEEAVLSIGRPVNLVCYAVAGLDCRFLVSPGGLHEGDPAAQRDVAGRVRSITTIGTAHRGTEVATIALRALEGDRGDEVLDVLLGSQVGTGGLPSEPTVRAALRGLGLASAGLFNERVVDADGVVYQSFAGVSHALGQPWFPTEASVRRFCGSATDPIIGLDVGRRDTMSELLLATTPYSTRTLGAGGLTVQSPSDGQIAVDSAKWGTFRGCLPADHYDLVGQLEDGGPDPITGFDAARFYGALVSDLGVQGL